MGLPGLVIAGGVLQILGFMLVVAELIRVQQRDLGTPAFVERWRGRFRRLLGRTKTHEMSATFGIKTSVSAHGKARKGPGKTLDDRVSAVEENLRRLDDEVDQGRVELEAKIADVRREVTLARSEWDEKRQSDEARRKADLALAVKTQLSATLLFVIGVALTVVGSTT